MLHCIKISLNKNKINDEQTKKSQDTSADKYAEVCCAAGLRGVGVALRFRRPRSGYGGQRASTSLAELGQCVSVSSTTNKTNM